MRRACIDIGSNTTRLLVADCADGGLHEIHQEREFTRLGHGLNAAGKIERAKLEEVADVVRAQLEMARRLGAAEVLGVGTAAIRLASNGVELASEIRSRCGLELLILDGEEEARLAFVGAVGTLEFVPPGPLGVVDVGGGSSELVVGGPPNKVSWCTSLSIGSADLAESWARSDPPSEAELNSGRERVAAALAGVNAPRPSHAVAVGGSATSLRKLAGDVLDEASFARTFELLGSARRTEIAHTFGLEPERVRLLPAGLLILQAAARLFGVPLEIARGGIREGVLLEASA